MESCHHYAWPVLVLHSGSVAEKTKVRGYFAFCFRSIIEQRHEKTNVLVSILVQHKLGCTATEDE